MNALITAEEVSALARPIYADEEIVSSIIAESEREDIKPRIGDRLYLTLKTKAVDELTNEESLLLNGGQWTSSNGDVHYLEGLKTALAYFVYSRIVRDGNIQSTRYGARIKSDENSTSTEDTERQRQYRQAFASADRYLAECLAFINRNSTALGECGREKKMRSNRTKFRVVGTGGGAASSPVCNSGGGILDSEEIIKILGYTPANAADIPDMSRVYELPDGGIPESDLSADVRNALSKGESASSDLSTFRPEVERALSERVRYADVVDGLESAETDKPLSANQGRVLKEGKQDKTSLVSDLATKVNALSSSDKAAFLGQMGAASEGAFASHENDNTRHITAAERTKWNAKQDALTLTIKDNGNIVIANIQGQSQEFMPATPSGDPMHYAYEAAGAVYNETGKDIVKSTPWADLADDDADKTVVHKAGYWYLNGLGDITNEQMRVIFIETNNFMEDISQSAQARYCSLISRTHMNPKQYHITTSRLRVEYIDFMRHSRNLESIIFPVYSLSVDYCFRPKKITTAFSYCPNLKYIYGIINLYDCVEQTDAFHNSPNIRICQFNKLRLNLNINNLNSVSLKSILYMIQNEAATSAITITLHADVYARAMANTDIVAALQDHPNVSLASA